MAEFWETAFQEKREMWGQEPAHSAILAKDLFVRKALKNVLIPGIGYGRNAKVFRDAGMTVTGIEISDTAIELAAAHYGTDITIHHGSVTDMPFDDMQYDGIFCHALIHLLDGDERATFIRDCYDQLADDGYMVFTVITKQAHTYGQGKFLSDNRYEMFGGVGMYFYDEDAVRREFGDAGLAEITEVHENYPFYMITCRKSTF